MALGTVIDESGFETGLDAHDFRLVDIRLLLFAAGRFDVEIVQPLAINHSDAQLFRLSCVNQHSFHF